MAEIPPIDQATPDASNDAIFKPLARYSLDKTPTAQSGRWVQESTADFLKREEWKAHDNAEKKNGNTR